jgi:MFS family permease
VTKPEPPRNQKVYARSMNSHHQPPSPPEAPAAEVWDLIHVLVGESPDPEVTTAESEPKQRRRGQARRRQKRTTWRRLLDVAGAMVWTFVVVKLFIGDLDRAMLAAFAPQAIWLLDFRWLLVLVLVALLLLLFKSRRLGLSLAYVSCFPLVLLCWKLPKFLIKKRSSLLVVGLAGIAISIGGRAKPFTIALAIACLSGFMISSTELPWVIAGITAMAVALIWWMAVTAIDLLRSTTFIRAQKKLIDWILRTRIVERLPTPMLPNRVTIQSWTVEDAKKFRDSAGYNVLITRILQFWAACLDQYRKGPSVVILNVIAAVGLTIQVMLAFTFINYGVYAIAPHQFSGVSSPDWWTFAYYSAAGTYFGEVGALAPVGTFAIVAKLANGLLGIVVIGTVISSIALNYRSVRADVDSAGVINTLSGKAAEIEDSSAEQHQMSFLELEKRLLATGWGLLGLTQWLSTRAETQIGQTTIDKHREFPSASPSRYSNDT